MLELIDLDQTISKEDYEKQFPLLERELGECQRLARAAGVPVIVVFEGWDASGKGTVINRLTQALDPRGFKVHPILAAERNRAVPSLDVAVLEQAAGGGRLGHLRPLLVSPRAGRSPRRDHRQARGHAGPRGHPPVRAAACRQRRGDRQVLAAHQQARAEAAFQAACCDSRATAWKVGKAERRQHRHYDEWLPAVEEMIAQTNSAAAPWTIVEATQRRFARVNVFRTLIAAVREALARARRQRPSTATTAADH